ncbi:MAG: Fe-S cluster assembly ATPase SufC [Bacilli bacterium]
MSRLEINNLHVSAGEVEILKGIDLVINSGEVHALMGPNGNGKSTLLNAVMGHPKYQITKGKIIFNDEDITNIEVDERARKGLFLAMQYPQEITGVTMSDFMRSAINAKSEKPISLYKFIKELETSTKEVGFDLDMVHRSINEGFSGGEKKRNELLQIMMLKPQIVLLDELDSGLDVDALNLVGNVLNNMQGPNFGCVIVSHYAKMYKLVKPTHVHVIINGKIVKSGGQEIIDKIDAEGYEWVQKELGIELRKEEKRQAVLASCGRKVAIKKEEK